MAEPARIREAAVDPSQRQLEVVGKLLALEKRARQSTTAAELGFVMVNETLGLVRYRQAALWRRGVSGAGEVVAVSGLAALDGNAPYQRWLRRLSNELAEHKDTMPRALHESDVPAELAQEWKEWLPAHVLWIPLLAPEGELLGSLLLAREESWSDADRHLLSHLAGTYGHAWAYLLRKTRREPLRWFAARRNRMLAAAAMVAFCAAWIPVRDSALGPAEVIAREPVVVRAPLDGVIDEVMVQPNQPVDAGQVLLKLDDARLSNQLEVARKALAVTEAEYRQVAQQAVFDQKSKAALVILQGRVEQHAAEVSYLESLLQRIEVRAPRPGVVVFDDVNDWIGKPVRTGERILMVADPADMELEVRLPAADAIALEPGSDVRLFLNIDPQHPVDATLTYVGYQATPGPDGILAYRLKAAFAAGELPPRVGLKGTAKVYGPKTSLFVHVFRRPMAAVRQWLGL